MYLPRLYCQGCTHHISLLPALVGCGMVATAPTFLALVVGIHFVCDIDTIQDRVNGLEAENTFVFARYMYLHIFPFCYVLC